MTHQKFSKILIMGTLALAIGACTEPAMEEKETSHIWPAEKWATSTPEAEGVNPAVINGLVQDLESGVYGAVDQFLFIRHGKVIADYRFDIDYDAIVEADGDNHPHAGITTGDHQYNYDHTNWHPYFNGTNLHSLQSITKSVTSAALGIAIDDGLIEGVEVPVAQFFNDYTYDLSDPRKSAITLEDFLTMRSGIDWDKSGGYSNDQHSTVQLEDSDTWIQFVLDRPMDKEPGTFFEYNDGVSVLLGKIIRQASGKRVDVWASERLFNPIGIRNFKWKITPDGEADTEGGLYLSTHDLARIGYLFLREGIWDGKQILSKEWVSKSVEPIVGDVSPDNERTDTGYGYQWWVPSFGEGNPSIFSGIGYGGQFVMVAPEYDIVVVFNGWNLHKQGEKSTYGVLQNVILPTLTR
jgi:CubicO group peptidase (beta-lactamase class C family)